MFWLASKLFWLVFHPLSLALILLALGWLLSLRSKKALGLAISGMGLSILLIACVTTLGAKLIQPLEARYERPSAFPADAAGIIVLGGGTDGVVGKAHDSIALNDAGERYVEAAHLALAHPDMPVLVTGGIGALNGKGETEAQSSARVFAAFGLVAPQILYESASRNTYENAVYSAELLKPKRGEAFVLITSAFHMPRSVSLFEKAGFTIIPWPADYRTTGDEPFQVDIGSASGNLELTAIAIREWIGLVAYWATGKIDSIFT